MNNTVNSSNVSNLTEKVFPPPCNHFLFDTLDKKTALIVGYFLVIIFSLVGNSLIILIIYKNPSMRTATNILIVNMSVSDMVFSIFYIPVYIYGSHFSKGPYWLIDGFFAAVFCKLYLYLNRVSLCVSILTMVAIAYDRFYAIIYPFKAKLRTSRSRIITIAIIWIVSLTFYIQEPIRHETIVWRGKTFCLYTDKLYAPYFNWILDNILFVILFILPFLLMCILYGVLIVRMQMRKLPGNHTDERQARENARNRRVVYMSVTVVVIFIFVISPWRLLHIFGSPRITGRWVKCWQQDLRLFFNFMMQSSCALNPFVYFAFSENYRQGLVKLLCCRKTNRVGVLVNNAALKNRSRNTQSTGAATRPSQR